jgi:flagellar hook assembly protein FlgD
VNARVINIAGRPVKTLVTGRDMESGLNTLLWNGHDQNGLAVPAGVYMVVVEARAADGAQSRAVCTVPLAR